MAVLEVGLAPLQSDSLRQCLDAKFIASSELRELASVLKRIGPMAHASLLKTTLSTNKPNSKAIYFALLLFFLEEKRITYSEEVKKMFVWSTDSKLAALREPMLVTEGEKDGYRLLHVVEQVDADPIKDAKEKKKEKDERLQKAVLEIFRRSFGDFTVVCVDCFNLL